MMKFLRSQSQAVLIAILVVLAGSFLFYGNVGNVLTGNGVHGADDYGRIDGEDISVAQLYDAVRNTRDSLMLSGRAQQVTTQEIADEAWRQLLLLHEADRLHIQVSDQELIDYIHTLPIFQKDGVYSPDAYQKQMTALQNNFHISPDTFETIIRNSLRTDAVSKALLAAVHAPAQDTGREYEKYYGPVQVSVVTIDPKNYVAQTTVSADEVAAEYKAHPENPAYRSAEKRKVDYVLFPLTPEQMKLTGKEKQDAIEALGEKALNLALSLQPDPTASTNSTPAAPPDFQAAAAKKGLTSATTDFFAADAPPSGLPPSPAFNNAAFALTKDDPISKVVELDNGVAVLHLSDIQPSELRPLDQLKADITKQLQLSKAGDSVKMISQFDAQVLKEQVAKGADFQKAAAALKLPVKTYPMFVPGKVPQGDQQMQTLAYIATQLPTGAVSPPVPSGSDNSLLVVHLDTRGPPDMSGLAAFETRFRESQDEQIRNLVYQDWANWENRQPDTHKPPNLGEFGGVE